MEKRPTLLLDTSSSLGGGITFAVRGLAGALLKRGETPRIVARDDDLSRAELDQWSGIDVEISERGAITETIFGSNLADTLLARPTSLVHLHGIWGVAARAATKSGQLPLIVSPHGMLDPWARNRSRLKKAISRMIWEGRLFGRAAAFHALNTAEANAIKECGYSGRIEVIPNGIDLPDLGPAGDTSSQAGKPKKVLLFLGRLHPKKGLAELVAAWANTSAALRESWELKIVGWDEVGLVGNLREQAKRLGVGDSVSFEGPVQGEAKDALFRQADAFILPSYSEGLPMAVLEAWSYRLPVLMTAACNLPEGFAAQAAIEIPVEPLAMAEILNTHLSEQAGLDAIARNGRRLAESDFGWAAVAKSMQELYRDCASR